MDFKNLLISFDKAESCHNIDEKAKLFKTASDESLDLINLNPGSEKRKIQQLRKSNLRILLTQLNDTNQGIEPETWVILVDIFFSNAKEETRALVSEFPKFKKYLDCFYWSFLVKPENLNFDLVDILLQEGPSPVPVQKINCSTP